MNPPARTALFAVAAWLCNCASGAPETPLNHQPSANRLLLGFGADATAAQRALEAKFDQQLQRANMRDWMKRMTSHAHHLGSPYGKEVAEFIATQFRTWGYDTEIEQFDVLFPTPSDRLLEMTAPSHFEARLAELPLPQDATSGLTDEQLPTYNAFSIDGDVAAELVYVNQGVPKDYELLERRGIDVSGKIVIARYGGSWRGIKPKVAAEHGAVGCLIYSDPRDDGYFEGDVYPQGSYRNENGAQRGSVVDMPLYPGDPLTPGVPAGKNAKRLAIKDAPSLTKIPVLPISYADALPLLKALTNGPVAPEGWRGALPITYHLGPGPAKVHLKLQFDWKLRPAYDVIAKLAGAEQAEQWVIRGNHHDAWVFGAEDPISGTVTLMEEARVLSELKKQGWRPKRTIVFTVWDGEEPGLIGSTEWVEAHAESLREHAVAYINTDNNGRGYLRVSGSHTLEKFVSDISKDVFDPEKKISVEARLRSDRIVYGSPDERREARDRADLRIGALGSGSDYTPFLQHLGVASLDIRYSGESDGGSYHSIYDSFDYYTRFGDPNFDYGIALAQTAGRAVLRLADAQTLPFEFTDFADTIASYLKEVKKLADDMREETRETNRQINDHDFDAVSDPAQILLPPKKHDPVPFLNFAPLDNALAILQESARAYEIALGKARATNVSWPAQAVQDLNAILMKTELAMTLDRGLPRREWYKHQIYAPGFYTGYGVKTLPAVREAIEQRRWPEADQEIVLTGRTLEQVAEEINRAATMVTTTSGQ